MRRNLMLVSILLLLGAPCVTSAQADPPSAAQPSAERTFTSDFNLGPRHVFKPDGGNSYLSLEPGTFRRYEGVEDGAPVVVEVTVLDQVRPIFFRANGHWLIAMTRAVEEREWIDGQLAEVSTNYFARDVSSSNVFYFGEDVQLFEDGELVSREGSWLAGRDGAQPGVFMPGTFLVGSRYYQEHAPGISMDRAENLQMGVTVSTPAGRFENCVVVLESSGLADDDDGDGEDDDDDETIHVYATGFGLVMDDGLVLVDYR